MTQALPDELETFTDGALGFAAASASDVFVAAGVCSAGTAATVYGPYLKADQVVTDLGSGPLVDWAATQLEIAKGKPVYLVKVNASVAGSNGAVTAVGTSPTLTLTGTPNDSYAGAVKVILGGVLGTSTFQYSLDGGKTYSQTIATAATYLIPGTGVTLNMAAGTYVAGDSYSWASVAPYYSTSDLGAAYDAADAVTTFDWEIMHVLGVVAGATDANKATALGVLFSACASKLNTSETNHHFRCMVLECPDFTDSSAGDAAFDVVMASLANPRIALCYGFVDILSPLSLRKYKRPSAWEAVARARCIAPNVDPAAVADGALPIGTKLGSLTAVYHDEGTRPGPGTRRLATVRKFVDYPVGWYLTNFPMFSTPGSDYKYLPHRRVIDIVARSARAVALTFLGKTVRTYPGTAGQPSTFDPTKIAGTIVEEDAIRIEQQFDAALTRDVVSKGYAISSVSEVNRTDLIQSTADLRYKTRTRMGTFIKDIEVEHGFAP